MSIAEAVAAHHHVVQGVVVLLLDLHPRVQQVIAQRVQLDELHPQVGDLQQVCAPESVGRTYEYADSPHWVVTLYFHKFIE